MNILPVNSSNYNNHTNSKQPNFGAFRIKNGPEMKTAKQILKKNDPKFYNEMIDDYTKILGKTTYFDGLLDINYGQFIFKLLCLKNFVWPGKQVGSVALKENEFYPRLLREQNVIEFLNNSDEILRLKKVEETERFAIYTVNNIINIHKWNWSNKASKEQANLIKTLDDEINSVAWKNIYVDNKPVTYDPFLNE